MCRVITVIMLLTCQVVSAREAGARYLIITHDDYYDAVIPLAEWKTQKGLKAKIVRLSEIGYDSTQIRAYVVNAYNTWQTRPEYLLLVGNKYQIPFPIRPGTETCYTDNYYTNITGDFRNEIIPGRFWVSNVTEAQTVVAKVLSYEREPFMEDSLWFGRGVTIINWDHPSYPLDSNYIWVTRCAHELMTIAGFNRIDSLVGTMYAPEDFPSDDSLDVLNAMNIGCSYVTYRGQAMQRWYQPFGDIYPSQMHNGFELPIVISATCTTLEGIGILWMTAGSPTEPKGAVGFMGTTTALSHSSVERSALMHGAITSIFRDSLSTLGRAVEMGRLEYSSLCNDSLDYDGWNCLGDPEMTVRTRTPRTVQVAYPQMIEAGVCTIHASVQCASAPVEYALVCLMAKHDTSLYHYGYTDSNGHVAFIDTIANIGDSLIITVTARNILPFYGLAKVYCVGFPYVLLLSFHLNDSIGGNCDGLANPGENIEVPFWAMNWGDTTAHGVTATIRKAVPDATVSLSDTIKYIGNISGRDSVYVSDGFNVQIAANCPDQHSILLEMEMTDIQDSSWVSPFSIRVHAPLFVRQTHYFPDFLLYTPAGTTDQLTVVLKNSGTYTAENTTGVLRSNDSQVTVIQSVASFGSVMPCSTTSNSDNPFVIATDPGTPPCHPVTLQLEVTSGVYVDTLECVIYVGAKDYFVWDPDPDHTSGPVIHEKLAALGYSGDYDTLFPYDLASIYKSLFVCCGEYWNSFVVRDTSRAAAELAFYLNSQGGRVYLEGGLVWRRDPATNNGYDLCPLFKIYPINTLNGYITRVVGYDSTFARNMAFVYQGGSIARDYITSTGGSVPVFWNMLNNLGIGVAADNKTIGVSFEFGFLVDSLQPSTKLVLIDSVMKYFGIEPTAVQEHYPAHAENVPFLSVRQNPSRGVFRIEYGLGQDPAADANLCLYDVSGRLVKEFPLQPSSEDAITQLVWPGLDDNGRELPSGVYFVRLRAGDVCEIRKAILLR